MRIAFRQPRDPVARRVLARAAAMLRPVAVAIPVPGAAPGAQQQAATAYHAEIDRLAARQAREAYEDALAAWRWKNGRASGEPS